MQLDIPYSGVRSKAFWAIVHANWTPSEIELWRYAITLMEREPPK